MSLDDILDIMHILNIDFSNININDLLAEFENINYSDISSEDLDTIKKFINVVLEKEEPQLFVKCWSDFIIIAVLFLLSLLVPVFKVLLVVYGGLVTINIGVVLRKYFRAKHEYYSNKGNTQMLRDVLKKVEDILVFRKRKSEAIDLEEIKEVQSAKTSSKVVNHDLNYLYKLIECVNASLINLSGDYKVYVNLRFNDALKSLDSIDNQESLDIVIAEFERTADIITEAQQEEQNLQNSETLKGEARS